MDELDKRILQTLMKNCRTPYLTMARKYGVSSNAIKNRVMKLLKTGVIKDFIIDLSLNITNTERCLVFVTTDGTENEESFFEQIGNSSTVRYIAQTLGGGYIILSTHKDGFKGLSKLRHFLLRFRSIHNVEIHPLYGSRGNTMKFSKNQFVVLRILNENPRIHIGEIKRRTGLSSRTISKIINDFIEKNCVQLTIRYDLPGGDGIIFLAQIQWNEKMTKISGIKAFLRKHFPVEFWETFSMVSAISPLLFAIFVVNDLKSVARITKKIRKESYVTSNVTVIGKPSRCFPDLKTKHLEELLVET